MKRRWRVSLRPPEVDIFQRWGRARTWILWSRRFTGGEGRELEAREITRFDEQFQLFLGFALVLLLVEGLIRERRRKKEVWAGRFS